jgi:hypothetical protein
MATCLHIETTGKIINGGIELMKPPKQPKKLRQNKFVKALCSFKEGTVSTGTSLFIYYPLNTLDFQMVILSAILYWKSLTGGCNNCQGTP